MLAVAITIAGCGRGADLASTPQGQALLKTNQIVQKSGGDWNKLSPADQQSLINGPGGGNVQAAQQYLAMEAARANFHPHAPAKPGPPAGVPSGAQASR